MTFTLSPLVLFFILFYFISIPPPVTKKRKKIYIWIKGVMVEEEGKIRENLPTLSLQRLVENPCALVARSCKYTGALYSSFAGRQN